MPRELNPLKKNFQKQNSITTVPRSYGSFSFALFESSWQLQAISNTPFHRYRRKQTSIYLKAQIRLLTPSNLFQNPFEVMWMKRSTLYLQIYKIY